MVVVPRMDSITVRKSRSWRAAKEKAPGARGTGRRTLSECRWQRWGYRTTTIRWVRVPASVRSRTKYVPLGSGAADTSTVYGRPGAVSPS